MLLILALVTLLPMAAMSVECPSASITPCFCQEVPRMVPKNVQITCPGLDSAQLLNQVVLKIQSSTSHVYKFTIRGGTFLNIPQDAFKDLSFTELEILDSTFYALTDTERALEGLEGSLVALVIKNSTALSDWDWLALKNLRNLARIQVDVDMGFVSDDISRISAARHVSSLTLAENRISHLDDEAFHAFLTLRDLSLRNNQISELKRSMFPNPGDSLRDLDFGRNQIRSLPTDLFDNMPNVRNLYIDSNMLYVLNEKPFSTIWSSMTRFHATGNKFRCDCRLLWITKKAFPKYVSATCSEPKQLKDKNFKILEASDLWC